MAETLQNKAPIAKLETTENVLDLGRKSKLSVENKLLLYKCMIKPIWTYGIQLWGCTKPSNTKIIQRFQSEVLRLIINEPWYVSNLTLQKDLQIPFVKEEIHRLSTLYQQSVLGHNNRQVAEISNPPNVRGRLRRQWPSDLPQPADEKKLKSLQSRHRACKSITSGWFLYSRHILRANLLIAPKKMRVDCKYTVFK
jgi:hypothetical protein